MKHILIFLILLGVSLNASLNTVTDDTTIKLGFPPRGFEPTMVGTNLIPTKSTDVELKKVRLKLKGRSHGKYVKVVTDYVLFNPSNAKKMVVTFDAGKAKSRDEKTSPHLVEMGLKVNGKYIKHLEHKVSLENKILRHVYLFELPLKKAKNHLMFEYAYRVSKESRIYYNFRHNLEDFSKWANKKIDLFELKVDIGKFQAFRLMKGFFQNKNELKFDGKIIDKSRNYYVTLYSKDGKIRFRKKDFSTKKKFHILSYDVVEKRDIETQVFDYKRDKLSFIIDETPSLLKGWQSDHILRALPYARRGFVFKHSKGIQDYFESLEWYEKNTTLERSNIQLSATEQYLLNKMIPEPLYDEGMNKWNRKGD